VIDNGKSATLKAKALSMRDLIDVLSSAAVSAALSAILIWLSREWISTRLKASIEHEYAEKLETIKAQLHAEHE
jgi:membrane protein implicated in regulation of membrane protease activity